MRRIKLIVYIMYTRTRSATSAYAGSSAVRMPNKIEVGTAFWI
jgi:hypothetical protein